MIDILAIPMKLEHHDGETPSVVEVSASELYPAVIARIQEVLAGAQPTELFALIARGGNARAEALVANARKLPAQAWKDALRSRDEFGELPYAAFVDRNGTVNEQLIGKLPKPDQADVRRMIQRGFALEICLGGSCTPCACGRVAATTTSCGTIRTSSSP